MSREEQVREFLRLERVSEMVERGLLEERRARQVAREVERAAFEALVSQRPDMWEEAAALGARDLPIAGTMQPTGVRLFGVDVREAVGFEFDWVGFRVWRDEDHHDRGRGGGEVWPRSPEGVPYYPGHGVTVTWRHGLAAGSIDSQAHTMLDSARRQAYLGRGEAFIMTRGPLDELRRTRGVRASP